MLCQPPRYRLELPPFNFITATLVSRRVRSQRVTIALMIENWSYHHADNTALCISWTVFCSHLPIACCGVHPSFVAAVLFIKTASVVSVGKDAEKSLPAIIFKPRVFTNSSLQTLCVHSISRRDPATSNIYPSKNPPVHQTINETLE